MSNKITGGPAFPTHSASDHHDGMTMRDYFAAKAMASLMKDFMEKELHLEYPKTEWMEGLCLDAYRMADAMLKEREL